MIQSLPSGSNQTASNHLTTDSHRSRALFAPMSLERGAKTSDQRPSGEGLRKKANCALLQRSGTSDLVGEGGDEYERHAMTLGANHRQELQPAHARHLQ